MLFVTLFSDLATRLFGTPSSVATVIDPELVSMGVEAVVDAVDPRLRAVSGYPKKIAPGVRRTITHLRELAQALPTPIMFSRGAWANDAFLNTVFATADDVPAALGRSQELRNFLAAPTNADASGAYALLGMVKTEREVFAPALIDDALRQDVAQTTVSFSRHRLLCPAADILTCRREVGMRILGRLAALALERITTLDERAAELKQHKAVLGARLRLLHLRQNGLEQIVQDDKDVATRIASIERELKETTDDYMETTTILGTLETRIQNHIGAIFGEPEQHMNLKRVTLRVNRLGYMIAADSSELASELTLHELTIGDGLKINIAFVFCPRTEMPPAQRLFARGAQALI